MKLKSNEKEETNPDIKEGDYSIDEKKQVTKVIMNLSSMDPKILEIETIKTIIDFKWNAYTKKFFFGQLILMLIFVVSYIVDVVAIGDSKRNFDQEDLKQIVPRLICACCVIFLTAYELFDFITNPLTHFKGFWNLNDILFFALYAAFFVISFT